MGSANFSEQAFRGWQHETLAMYDDDDAAWDYYSARYREVRDKASQHIDPPWLSPEGFGVPRVSRGWNS